jgi:A118 family predicted phage portal protein
LTLREHIRGKGYNLPEDVFTKQVAVWEAWYRGRLESFHSYTIQNQGKTIKRRRATLNMAKRGAEYWADLLWTERCHVNLKDISADAAANDTLKGNDFWRKFNRLIEQAFAIGTGACVVYRKNDATHIDYIGAGHIFPIVERNGDIESCVFADMQGDGKERVMYLMWHLRQQNGTYTILNEFFSVGSSGEITQIGVPAGIEEEYTANAARFAIVRPNIANNLLGGNGMGMSIYANSLDTLKCIDLAYDGAKVSMEIGRPRIGVSSNMLRVNAETGEQYPVFDANDIAVYVMGGAGVDDKVAVEDLTTEYRAGEYEGSLEAQIKIYGQAIGLGDQAFQWDAARGGIKTATEVISTNSTMLRAMEKHQQGLRSTIVQLVRGVLDAEGVMGEQEIDVVFDDSVTRDKRAEAAEAWPWVLAGMYPFWKFLVDFKGYDEEEAKEIAAASAQDVLPVEE